MLKNLDVPLYKYTRTSVKVKQGQYININIFVYYVLQQKADLRWKLFSIKYQLYKDLPLLQTKKTPNTPKPILSL